MTSRKIPHQSFLVYRAVRQAHAPHPVHAVLRQWQMSLPSVWIIWPILLSPAKCCAKRPSCAPISRHRSNSRRINSNRFQRAAAASFKRQNHHRLAQLLAMLSNQLLIKRTGTLCQSSCKADRQNRSEKRTAVQLLVVQYFFNSFELGLHRLLNNHK